MEKHGKVNYENLTGFSNKITGTLWPYFQIIVFQLLRLIPIVCRQNELQIKKYPFWSTNVSILRMVVSQQKMKRNVAIFIFGGFEQNYIAFFYVQLFSDFSKETKKQSSDR